MSGGNWRPALTSPVAWLPPVLRGAVFGERNMSIGRGKHRGESCVLYAGHHQPFLLQLFLEEEEEEAKADAEHVLVWKGDRELVIYHAATDMYVRLLSRPFFSGTWNIECYAASWVTAMSTVSAALRAIHAVLDHLNDVTAKRLELNAKGEYCRRTKWAGFPDWRDAELRALLASRSLGLAAWLLQPEVTRYFERREALEDAKFPVARRLAVARIRGAQLSRADACVRALSVGRGHRQLRRPRVFIRVHALYLRGPWRRLSARGAVACLHLLLVCDIALDGRALVVRRIQRAGEHVLSRAHGRERH